MGIIAFDLDLKAALGEPPAALLNKLLYWEPRAKYTFEGEKWVYKTYTEFAEELGYAVTTVRRAVKTLLDHGLILQEKKWAALWKQTSFYRVNREALAQLTSSFKRTDRVVLNEQIEPSLKNNSSLDPVNTNKNYTQFLEQEVRERDTKVEIHKEKQNPNVDRPPVLKNQELEENQVLIHPSVSSLLPGEDQKYASKKSKKGKIDFDLLAWLRTRAQTLGKTDPYAWAYVVARSLSPDLQLLYERHRTQAVGAPVEPVIPSQPEVGAGSLAVGDHLARLQAKWSIPFQQKRHQREVIEAIAQHPEWGLICDSSSGPALASVAPDGTAVIEPTATGDIRVNLSETQSAGVAKISAMPEAFQQYHSVAVHDRAPETSCQIDPPNDLADALAEISVLRDVLEWCKDKFNQWLYEVFGCGSLDLASDDIVFEALSLLQAKVLD